MAGNDDNTYPLIVGLVFLFNLILGTGVLAMPAVFYDAGYILGTFVLVLLCLISFVQTTFVIEAMSCANYHFRKLTLQTGSSRVRGEDDDDPDDHDEYSALLGANDSTDEDDTEHEAAPSPINADEPSSKKISESKRNLTDLEEEEEEAKLYDITEKFELGSMTEMFFNKTLSRLFFVSMLAYLYGDLVIYNTMMAKSLREIICHSPNCSVVDKSALPCWSGMEIGRHSVYRICMFLFLGLITPLIYAGIKKNSVIQLITIALRWIAFSSMIGICIKIFVQDKNTGQPLPADFVKMPRLFGICVYAFMCHHSLPAMITPIRNKTGLYKFIGMEYILLIAIYLAVTLSGVFSFADLNDVYTLNFQKNNCNSHGTNGDNPAVVPVLDIFLPTFPIFTLFSSYTVIALTLINTLKVVLDGLVDVKNRMFRLSFPLIAIIPPLFVSYFTEDVSGIVSYVGSYTGSVIQYVFPALLVYYARKNVLDKHLIPARDQHHEVRLRKEPTETYYRTNPFASPFQSNLWVYATLGWWLFSLILVTTNFVIRAMNKN